MDPVIQILEDLHNERAGYYRAFWSDTPDSDIVVTVLGYASPGGTHRTIKATALEAWRYYPLARIYRNGKEIKYNGK